MKTTERQISCIRAGEPTARAMRACAIGVTRARHAAGAVLLTIGLAACGGGGENLDVPAPLASAPPASPAPVARVEILATGTWLPGNGQSRQLRAQAYDAAGNAVAAAVTWSSSRATHVAVDASGTLTSQVTAGSAQITAQANGITSAPILAYVATPAPGVRVIDDANIVGELVETDPAAQPSLANTYGVTLTAVAAPAVGDLMLGRGDKPLAGRVTAVTAAGAQTQVTLQLAPITELFAELEIEELIDLSGADVQIPPDVEAQFNVTRNGNRWTFAPKATPTTTRARPQSVTGTYPRDILPFRSCEASFLDFENVTDLPIGLEPPSFSVTLDPTLDYVYSRRGGLTRFIVNAESTVEMSAALKAQAALAGGLGCKLQLFALRLPIGGPLAFFVGGYLPVGVGFELEANATLSSFKLGAKAAAGTKASLGWNCPGPECTFVRSLENVSATIEPIYEAPTLNGNMRVEAELGVYGYVEAELGSPLMRSLRFKALEVRIGGKAKGSFETSASQLRNLDYVSKYGAELTGSASTGIGVGDTLRMLGFTTLTNLALEFSTPLATSPRAQSVRADRASFAAGDRVNVKVTLDPASLNFLPDTYNVKTVQVQRRVGDATEILAAQTASTGQQVFEFEVTAPADGHASSWGAFIVTRLVDSEMLSLEVGRVRGSNAELPPIPPGYYQWNEEVGFSMTLASRTENFPGLGQCEALPLPGDILAPLPFSRTFAQSCSFPEGTVTSRVETVHTSRGSGRVKVETGGRIQASTNHFGFVNGGVGPSARQWLVIMAPRMTGLSGTVSARFRVRINGQLPSFPSDCDTCFGDGQARLDFLGMNEVVEGRMRTGNSLPPAQRRPSIQMERTLDIPFGFTYGEPFPIDVRMGASLMISGTPLGAVGSDLRIEYEWLDFQGLPEGATVDTDTGPVWPLPTE